MSKISTDMLQGPIIGPLLFNIFNNDFFLFIKTTTLCNYAEDKNTNIVISRFRHNFAIMSEWFYENYMVVNADKCHFLTAGFNEPFQDFSFNDTTISKKKLTKNSVHSQQKQPPEVFCKKRCS